MGNETELLVCYHCGNRVPQKRVGYQRGQKLYEHIDGRRYSEDFDYYLYQCPTCQGINIYGDFAAYPYVVPSKIVRMKQRIAQASADDT